MMSGTVDLAATVQSLIDARLDTIDRMLVGRVPRADRLAIVHEVESQIHELLQGRGDAPTRDDVLAVLARLDPPEAYLPDEEDTESLSRPRPLATPGARPTSNRTRLNARISGILGLVALSLTLLFPLFLMVIADLLGDSLIGVALALGLPLLVIGALAIISLVQAALARLSGAWAITGLVTGIISLLASLIGMAYLAVGILSM